MICMNSYWPIYKKLEEEFLKSSEYVSFEDSNLKVYSNIFLDIMLRCWIEIESISKELYLSNGGTPYEDETKMFFDTVCLKYLSDNWEIDKKEIIITGLPCSFSCKTIKPLEKCFKRSNSGKSWQKAYQRIKHNRSANYKDGNLLNCLMSLGALYILNVYYRDEKISLQPNNLGSFDSSFSSTLFSATVDSDTGSNPHSPSSNCVYCVRLENDSLLEIQQKTDQLNKMVFEKAIKLLSPSQLSSIAINASKGQKIDLWKILDSDTMVQLIREASIKVNIAASFSKSKYVAFLNKTSDS